MPCLQNAPLVGSIQISDFLDSTHLKSVVETLIKPNSLVLRMKFVIQPREEKNKHKYPTEDLKTSEELTKKFQKELKFKIFLIKI